MDQVAESMTACPIMYFYWSTYCSPIGENFLGDLNGVTHKGIELGHAMINRA